ncbi:hypothetical protein AAL_07388 [Moelleriella libera RCEF 2490]|uniref:Uncharacterized protein n=1 Tax=Moelleriella libera RCEF 2490 TaxID=1081109 RepID=A0A167XNH6_9HYPO|nr:hypothetical protein AAL_07388 [Moelleriella libera RCEF 2490]
MHTRQLTQVIVRASSDEYAPVTKHTIDVDAFARDEAHLQETILKLCPADLWYHGSYAAGYCAALVERRGARFPKRMPLEAEEEELLKWIEDQVAMGNMRPFSQCMGSWRPDFLVEENGHHDESYCITEINARFCFNGFLHEAYGQEALNRSVQGAMSELVGATDSETIMQGLFSLFQPSRPLHLPKGAEEGIDIHMFIDVVRRRFGIKPRLIAPADLRLLPDAQSKSGFRQCCVIQGHDDPRTNSWRFAAKNGEVWEEVQQVGLELHQRELAALDAEMLRQISLRCFNDMRTVLLVHDKRMLGIVRQEVPRLLSRKVLTTMQAEALDSGVVETILPGSTELQTLIQTCVDSPHVRHGLVLKPIRSGKGNGIVFGDDMTAAEWVSRLQDLVLAKVISGVSCVVQRRITPREYDLVLRASVGMVKYPLVGTYHVTNGRLLGLGTWRASGGRIVAVSSGGSWICSVMRRENECSSVI